MTFDTFYSVWIAPITHEIVLEPYSRAACPMPQRRWSRSYISLHITTFIQICEKSLSDIIILVKFTCRGVAWAWCHHTPCAFCSGVAWPVDPSIRLTRWPVNLLTFSKKNPSRAIARSTNIHHRDVSRRPVWPVASRPVWAIDPLTHRPGDLLEKEPLKVHLHTPLRCSAIAVEQKVPN